MLFSNSAYSPNSNLTHLILPQDLKDLSKPLTSEQIEKIDKDPSPIIDICYDKLMTGGNVTDENQLKLCDSFMLHLDNKCKEFSNLLSYCTITLERMDTPFDYLLFRGNDLTCKQVENANTDYCIHWKNLKSDMIINRVLKNFESSN